MTPSALLGASTTTTPPTISGLRIARAAARACSRRRAASPFATTSPCAPAPCPGMLRPCPALLNAAARLLARGAGQAHASAAAATQAPAVAAHSGHRRRATVAARAAAPAPASAAAAPSQQQQQHHQAAAPDGYETVVGIETHVQLQTRTKAFCGCPNRYGDPPNTNICPVCLGHPGALPVYGAEALRLGVLTGLALGARVAARSRFDRKQYFYADLPKGYQISQHEGPLCTGGSVVVDFPEERGAPRAAAAAAAAAGKDKAAAAAAGGKQAGAAAGAAAAAAASPLAPPLAPLRRAFGVTRAHLEEDAGKSVHGAAGGGQGGGALGSPSGAALTSSSSAPSSSASASTHVDFNRAGVPLLEIVSEPDMRSGRDAAAYAAELRRLVRALGVSDGDLSRGGMRCDVNVSVRPRAPPGQAELPFGTKVEVKNLNSFANIQRAVEFETARQTALLEGGRGSEIVQETRLWDEARGETVAMRRKEGLADYRYFPEPDLPEVLVGGALLAEARAALEATELPARRRDRYLALGLPRADALQLADDEDVARYFDACLAQGAGAKAAANWIMGDAQGWCKERKCSLGQSGLPPAALAELLRLIDGGTISGKIAKDALPELLAPGGPVSSGEDGAVRAFVEARGLVMVSDRAEVERMVDTVLAASPSQLAAYAAGKAKLAGYFTGLVMKASEGRVQPALMNEVLAQRLGAAVAAAAAAAAAAAE